MERPARPGTAVEPVSPDPPDLPGRALLTQWWLDLAFLHWPVEPEFVAPLLPSGTRPDLLDGVTYVGLIAFRMHRIGWLGLPGLPYFGSFPETNVRLYSVDRHGRRGVVFRSLEASRLLPVLVARSAFRLPYQWAKMTVQRTGDGADGADGNGKGGGARGGAGSGDVIDYTSRRRWSAPRGSYARISIRVGEPIAEPSPLEHFVTARWGLHNDWFGRPMFLPNAHPRWTLRRASLLRCDEDLVAAAGLPAPVGPPASVLYSPGVPVRFGRPLRPSVAAGVEALSA